MACRLSQSQIESLYKLVFGQIIADKNKKVKFDPDTYMRTLYTRILEKSKDRANALDYIQHVPTMIISASANSTIVADYFLDNNIDINALYRQRRDFDNLDNVIKFLGIDSNQELEAVTELLDQNKPDITSTDPDTYDQVEASDPMIKKEAYKRVFYIDPSSGAFIAKPESALSTIGQEAKDYDGFSIKDNIRDDDPKKMTYYKVVRRLNDMIPLSGNADNVQLGAVNGVYLKAVVASQIPYSDLYASDQRYLSTDDPKEFKKGKTSEQKMQSRESGKEILLVFTDKDGNILYFDSEGYPTTQEAGGTLAYTKIRTVLENEYGRYVKSVQQKEEIRLKRGLADFTEVNAERNYQIQVIDNTRSYLEKNPESSLLFSIQAGRNGHIREDFDKRTLISKIDLEGGFNPTYAFQDDGFTQSGGVYFMAKDYEFPVLILRPRFSEIGGLTDALTKMMFDSSIDPKKKVEIMNQFVNSKKTIVKIQNDSINISHAGTTIDLGNPNNRQAFADLLNGMKVNIKVNKINTDSFMLPTVNDKGEVTISDQNYNNFLSDNFYTHLEVNAENRLIKLNAYNVIAPTKATAEIIIPKEKVTGAKTESTLESETPSDQSIDQFMDKLNNFPTGLKKIAAISSAATAEQIKEAKRWWFNHPASKYTELNVLFNVVNSDAVAEFTLSGIYLYKGSNFTDIYHESWHMFSQMFLTKPDKKKLYGEARNLIGTFKTRSGKTVSFAKATDIQLEEFMGEDFRQFALSKGTKMIDGRPVRNNTFKRIWNFLKALFKRYSLKQILLNKKAEGAIAEMYNKLYVGNINEYKPSIDNVQFTQLFKGIQKVGGSKTLLDGLNYQESMEVVQTIDSLIASNLAASTQSIGVLFTRPDIMDLMYKIVYNNIVKLEQKATDPDVKRVLRFTLDHWGDYDKVLKGEQEDGVIAFHKLKSDLLTFEDKYEQLNPEDVDDDNNTNTNQDEATFEEETLKKGDKQLEEQFGSKVGDKKGNEVSVRELASKQTVYLVSTLPQMDRSGKVIMNRLGAPKLVDLSKTWGTIINTIAGSKNKTEMYNKLVQNSKMFPNLKSLVEEYEIDGVKYRPRLGNPAERVQKSDYEYYVMWTAFFSDFSVYRIPINEVQVVRETELKEDEKTGKTEFKPTGKFEVRFVEAAPLFQQVRYNFTSLFQTIQAGPLARFVTKSAQNTNILNYEEVAKAFDGNFMDVNISMDFLRSVGIYMTDNPLIRQELNKPDVRSRIKSIYDAFKKLAADKKRKVIIDNPIAWLKSYQGQNSGNVDALLDIEGRLSSNYSNNSIQNVNDDLEYDLSLNNSITQKFKEINSIDDYLQLIQLPHMAHLNIETNPHAKYSTMLGSLYDLDVRYKQVSYSNKNKRRVKDNKTNAPVRIHIVNMNGVRSIDAEINRGVETKKAAGGIKTASLDGNSKFLFDLHTMLEKGVVELTRRSSKSSAFGVFVDSINTPYNTNDKTSYIEVGMFADINSSTNAAVDLLMGKIAAEMERIAILKEDIENNGELSKIPGFSQRGLSFSEFDDILDSDLQKDLIAVANASNSYSVINTPEFKERIHNSIASYLEKLYEENKDFYYEMPYLSDKLKDKIRKQTKRNDLTDAQLEEIALRWFGFNYIYHNMEILALIDGDLAMFDNEKQEYNKRGPYVTSTGRVFSTDESDLKFINNLMNTEGSISYARKIGAPMYNFTTVVNTAVFRDVDVRSAYFDSYVDFLVKSGKYTEEEAKKILKKYTEMTEGDGQGWITFDMYRILSILDNKWGPKQNELYVKIINGENVDPDDITEFFPPRKFQYGGPLKTRRLHIPGFHKFSLVPLVPSVIKGKNLEILHDNLTMQGFGYGLFLSGSKLGTLTKDGKPDVFYENDDFSLRQIKRWKPGDPTYTANPIFLQYLKNQTEVSSEWKNKTIFPTQLRKLIINDLFEAGIALTPDIQKLVDDLQQQLNDLQNFKKQELLEEIGWILDENGKPTGDVDKLLVFVKKELARQGAPDHVIDFIDVDGTGKRVRYDLSLSLNAEQIEKILNAIVVKRLIRQKVKGEQLVQISGAGFESAFRKATKEEELKYKGTNDLPFYRPTKDGATTAMKIKIAMKGDYYKLLELNDVKKLAAKKDITPLEALNELIRTDEWLNKGDNRKLVTLVGVRIPVQGLNSMEFMEVYEFLPEEAGNILIPPAEIVAKSGGDFDIDKLFILEPNYRSSKPYAVYSKGDNAKGTSNKVIESIRKILEHPKNFETLIRPNDTDLVKPIADDLAKKNLQGYNVLEYKMNAPKKNKKGAAVMSPTRFIEPRYNAYKHEVFNIAKRTLGIGAVDNAYSSMFKQINASLYDTYTSHRDQPKKRHTRRVHILMDHNTTNINGKEYISLAKLTTQEKQKVSDLISQLMNGWLDIEKDSWIFDVNGNTMAGPVLLFLIEAGVNFRTAAYFVSQPLIIKYIKERYRAESPFYEAAGMGLRQGKGLNKYQARVKMIRQYIDPGIKDFIKAKDLYKNYMEGRLPADTKFTQENLLESIESNQLDNETAQRALLHFFELEDIMGNLTSVKLTVNVDTSPSRSFFDAQNRLLRIQGLEEIDIIDSSLLNKIKTSTPISSFFIQDFQLNLFAPLMPMRANRIINDFIVEKIKDGTYSQGFDNTEKFQAAFKNDIPLYLLQNYIKGADIDKMTEYQGVMMETSVPIQKLPILRNGAFYDTEKGVMYVDKEKIKKDFADKAFAGEEYKQQGLYVLDPQTFASSPSFNMDIQEYVSFVLEREYLRGVVPTEGKSREVYEKEIATKALENTFNFYHMLKSPESLANVFLQLRDQPAYKAVKDQYAIFDMIGPSSTKSEKAIKNLRLNSLKMDKDMINVLHENLVRLSDIGTVKINDPVRNEKLSQFFTKLIIAEYLRAGTTKSVDSLASILPPGTLTKLLIDRMEGFKITKDFLENYYPLFLQNWSTRARSKQMRNKMRVYLDPNVVIKPLEADVAPYDIVQDPFTGVSLYKRYQVGSAIREQLARNQGIVFVIPINEDNVTEAETKTYREGNSVGVYVKKKGGAIAWTDDTYDNNISLINKSIEDIINKIKDGHQVVFPMNGLVSITNKNIDNVLAKAPRTFEYLVTELYKNFGYRHPGAENILGFREAVQAQQPISDAQLDEFIKKCFGS